MTFRHRLVIKEAPTAADLCAAVRRRWWLWLPITGAIATSTFFLVHNRHTANAPPEVKTGILRVSRE